MPPKTSKAKAAPKKGGKKKEDADFDALLTQLEATTKAKGNDVKGEPVMTQAERKAAHRQRVADETKAREASVAKSIEDRAQQKKLQDLIRDMVARGGGAFQSPFLTDGPKTDITTQGSVAKNSRVVAGCAEMQGWRRAMEDAHIMYPNYLAGPSGAEDWHLFAVMDGHGGATVANTTKLLLPAVLHQQLQKRKNAMSTELFIDTFVEVDAALKKKHGNDAMGCGTTCVAVMIGATEIHCASVGDSRAVLARKGSDFVSLSFDHKPENADERKRILAANGTVENNRVNGSLAMSRALGDFTYKTADDKGPSEQQVIPIPEVHVAPRRKDDEFLAIACDGIFDVLSNEQLVSVIREEMRTLAPGEDTRFTAEQLSHIAGNVTKLCLAPAGEEGSGPARGEGSDNMTITIVQL